MGNDTEVDTEEGFDDYMWFYIKRVPYFLESDRDMDKVVKDENLMKNESSISLYNLEGIKEECKVSDDNLIDQYDEETILLQIPQEDTEVGDVMKKFKNRNKAADTIVVLQEKKKVIVGVMDGQSYIRRLSSIPRKKDPKDVNRSRPNTWRCGKCGKKFQAQNPYQDRSGHAICEDCWKKLINS